MLADVDLLEPNIAIEGRAAKLADEQRSAGRPPRAQPGEGTTATDDSRRWERTRNTNVLREQRNLTTGHTGVVIAQDFYGTIIEAQKVSESDPSFGGFINSVDFLTTSLIKISLAELEDSYCDLDAWIRTAFGKRIARGLSSLIVSGSSSGNIQSIITTASTGVTSAAPASLAYEDFVGLYS